MNKLGSRLNLSMESAVFMDKPRLRSELSMESGVFMDKRTDGVFEATCHPRLGGASEGGGGRRNTPSVRFMYRAVTLYAQPLIQGRVRPSAPGQCKKVNRSLRRDPGCS